MFGGCQIDGGSEVMIYGSDGLLRRLSRAIEHSPTASQSSLVISSGGGVGGV